MEELWGFELVSGVLGSLSLLRKVLEWAHLPPAGSAFWSFHISGFAFALSCPGSLINYGPSPFCALAKLDVLENCAMLA